MCFEYIYQLLVEKTDKETAETLTNYIGQKIEKDIQNKANHLATKEDLARVKTEMITEIAKTKVEMIRWYVALFVILSLMIAGLYLKK